MKLRLLACALALLACGPAPERPDPAPVVGMPPSDDDIERATRNFRTLRENFLPWYYRSHPVEASVAGIAEHDGEWPAVGRRAVQRQIDSVLHWLAELERVPLLHLRGPDRYDYGTLEYALRAELLDLEEVRSWARDPRLYTATIATGIASVAERRGMSEEERRAALAARLRTAPDLLAAARETVTRPPRLWTDLAVAHTTGLIAFLETALPALLAGQPGVAGAALPPELEPHRDRLVQELREHRDWLETELRGQPEGEFRLGRYLFERMLLYEEHIALEVPELHRVNGNYIADYRQSLRDAAAEIDEDRTPREILDSLRVQDQPADPADAVRAAMVSLRDWTLGAGVVTVHDTTLPAVRPMPAFRTDVLALDGAGAFADAPLYVSVALPQAPDDTGRAPARVAVGRTELVAMTARSTFPGAYVQLAHEREVENELRRAFTARSFVDGWAHYAEGLALEHGYGAGDPALLLVYLRRALHEHARMDAILSLHGPGSASIEDVVQGFMDIALVDEDVARQEVARATYDPLYMAAALGRLQIVELRKDYSAWLEERDEAFDLRAFHDRVLGLALPLPMAREVLMPEPEPEERRGTRRRR